MTDRERAIAAAIVVSSVVNFHATEGNRNSADGLDATIGRALAIAKDVLINLRDRADAGSSFCNDLIQARSP